MPTGGPASRASRPGSTLVGERPEDPLDPDAVLVLQPLPLARPQRRRGRVEAQEVVRDRAVVDRFAARSPSTRPSPAAAGRHLHRTPFGPRHSSRRSRGRATTPPVRGSATTRASSCGRTPIQVIDRHVHLWHATRWHSSAATARSRGSCGTDYRDGQSRYLRKDGRAGARVPCRQQRHHALDEQRRRPRVRQRRVAPGPRRVPPPGRRLVAGRHRPRFRRRGDRGGQGPDRGRHRGRRPGRRDEQDPLRVDARRLRLFTVGAVVVPIYETSSAEQVEWILSDSGARGAFVETDEHAAIVESVRAQAPDLVDVWTVRRRRASTRSSRDGADVADDDVHQAPTAVTLDDPPRSSTPPAPPAGPRAASCCTAASSPNAPSWPRSCAASSTRPRPRCCSCRSRTCSAASSRSARCTSAARSATRRTSRT